MLLNVVSVVPGVDFQIDLEFENGERRRAPAPSCRPYSIISVACSRSVCGTVKPSALAV